MAKIPERAILQVAKQMFEEAVAQREPTEVDYLEALQLEDSYNPDYQNDKANWQSKVVLPDLIAHCRSVAAGVTRLFRAEKDWPNMIARSPEKKHQKVCDVLGKTGRLYLEQSGFFRLINSAIYTAGLAGYCPLYVGWKQENYPAGFGDTGLVMNQRGRLDIRVIDPMEFWRDPTNYMRFHIVRRVTTVPELKARAEEWGYDTEAVARIETGKMPAPRTSFGLTRTSASYDQRQRDLQNVELLDFCGEMYTQDGDRIMENGKFTFANLGTQDLLVYQPKEYNYIHGGSPYVFLDPVNDGRQDYPISYARPYVPLIKSLSDVFNLMVDIAHESRPRDVFSPNMYEGDPEDIVYGLYPGQPFLTKGVIQNAFQTVNSGANPQNVMAVLGFIQQMTQSLNAGLIQAGVPSARGRQTATEVNYAQMQASAVVAAITDGLVETGVMPLVRKALYLMIQNMTPEEWASGEIRWLLGEQEQQALTGSNLLADMLESMAICTIDISAPGRAIERQVTLEGLTNLFKNLAAIGPGYLNIENVVADLTRFSNLDPARYLNPEFNHQMWVDSLIQTGRAGPVIDQMMQAQQAQMGGGMPGMGGGGAPAPSNPMNYNNPGLTMPGLGG